MNLAQFQGLMRHALTVGGTVVGVVGVVNPQWGVVGQSLIVAAGAIVAAISATWSYLAPEKISLSPAPAP